MTQMLCRIPCLAGTLTALALAMPAIAAPDVKQDCDVARVKADLAAPPPGVLASLAAPWKTTNCSALLRILRMAGGAPVSGGRKLENDKPLDVAAAERELAQARADNSVAAELATELEGETDPVRRMLLEAAVLQDNGLYLARDLLVMRLRAAAVR